MEAIVAAGSVVVTLGAYFLVPMVLGTIVVLMLQAGRADR